MADWSQQEVEVIVADYFAMWGKDLRGEKFSKAEHNRRLQRLLQRSEGSVEKKHQNISAVLWHLGYPYLRGYKPLPKYQKLLRVVVEERLAHDIAVNRLVKEAVLQQEPPLPLKALPRQVSPPKPREIKKLIEEEPRRRTKFARRNYLELEARNQSLGLAGEQLILKLELDRLVKARKDKLASQVRHVSFLDGDYHGFDILSFETDGREKLIEVKTTRYGELTRFFASANEVDVSRTRADEYRLYRLFDYDDEPRFFVLPGAIESTCQLTVVGYSAVPARCS